MATIRDISREAGVSITTVSKVLNNNPIKVSAGTRERIKRIARELDYHPNMLARALVNRHINALGVILPDIGNPFYAYMARGLSDAAAHRGYTLMFSNTDAVHEREQSSIEIMAGYNLAGIILVGNFQAYEINVKRVSEFDIPYVSVEAYIDGQDYCVYVDNFTGTYNAINYLIERGHRRIGYICHESTANDFNDRFKGYRMAMEENGLDFDPSLVEYGSCFLESGYQKALQLLRRNADMTAIACGSDIIAIGAIRAVKECGLKVPEDCSIIGFDDVYLSTIAEPRLTTVRQPTYEMGICAVNMLLDRIEKKEGAMKRKCFQPMLVERDSVRSIN